MSELRATPLIGRHRDLGAKLVEFAGWEMPLQYAGLSQEHHAVRRKAGLFDVSHMGEIEVSGPGSEAFLQWLTPNDVSKLGPGRAHYSGLLNEAGGYLDDLLVYRREGGFLLVVNAANREADVAWVKERAAGHEVEVRDVSDEMALLAVQGPTAPEVVQALTGADLEAVRYYRFVEGEVAGRRAIISRTGYTGEDGFELYLGADDAVAVWDAVLEAGDGLGLEPAGLGARDTLRLEAAMALYGHELDETTTPWEAGLAWVVKMEAGDFVGRQALARQREAGLPRALIGFEIEGRGIARQGAELFVGDRSIGRVTSGSWSPTLERALGLAYVETGTVEIGASIEADVRGRRLPARVVETPFYRRPKK